MGIHVVDLSHANLRELPDWSAEGHGQDLECKFCLYWECPDREQWPESLPERAERKRQWFHRVAAEFGACGKLALLRDAVVGYAQFGPARCLPNVADYSCGPVSDDAIFISCLYVPSQRGEGIGSTLLEAILRDLRERGLRAAETFALKGSANNPSGPVEFWIKHRFSVVREDVQFALMRRELG